VTFLASINKEKKREAKQQGSPNLFKAIQKDARYFYLLPIRKVRGWELTKVHTPFRLTGWHHLANTAVRRSPSKARPACITWKPAGESAPDLTVVELRTVPAGDSHVPAGVACACLFVVAGYKEEGYHIPVLH